MQYTDTQLKQALAKMLPETTVTWWSPNSSIAWMLENGDVGDDVKDTELLHLCWLVEETLTSPDICIRYFDELIRVIKETNNDRSDSINSWSIHTTWQQRTIALAKVNGIEIV